MKSVLSLCVLLCTFVCNHGEDVRLLDLDPNDAQQLIDSQDTSLKYAPKIDSNVPAVRYLGNEPHNVVEDIYLANQYHGQDGLGGYLYGYAVPDIAKTERKKAGGDLRGAYNYIAGNGQEIKVEYWDDGTGFHQVDNVPKVLPQQIDDTPEVKAAKEEHARLWQEQAERNSHPIQSPYNSEGQYASGPLSVQAQLQRQQQLAQQPQYHGQPQGQYQNKPQGQYQPQGQGQYQQQGQGQYQAQQQGQYQGQPQGQYQNKPQGQFTPVHGNPQAHPGQHYQPQQSQNVNQYQPKPVLTQTQDQNDIYSGQFTENKNKYAQANVAQAKPGQYQPGQYQQGQGQQGHGQQGQGQQHQGQYQQGQPSQGQYQQGQSRYQQGQQYQGQEDDGSYNEGQDEEGVTGPPRGFFYKFDYPVGIIVSKDGGSVQKREGDLKDVYAQNKAQFEGQLAKGGGQGGSYLVQ